MWSGLWNHDTWALFVMTGQGQHLAPGRASETDAGRSGAGGECRG